MEKEKCALIKLLDEWREEKDVHCLDFADIEQLQDILDEIKTKPFAIQRELRHFIGAAEQERIVNGYCPNCDNELKSVCVGQQTEDVHGTKQSWDVFEARCPNCGWTED